MIYLKIDEIHLQNEIASHIGKMLRDAFGKGPQAVYASFRPPYNVIYLRNFITPIEKILLAQGQITSIQMTRDLVMKWLIPQIKAFLLSRTGMDIVEFYYDWELLNHSGVFVWRQSNDPELLSWAQGSYDGKDELHYELGNIGEQIQKRPDQIYSCMINKRTLLIIRCGILIEISIELLRIGSEASLRQAVSHLEKKNLRNNKFQTILNTNIDDVFIDWDFKMDRSIIVLILSP